MGKVALLSQKDAIVELFVYQKVNRKANKKTPYWPFLYLFSENIHEKSENRGEKMQKFA